MDMHQSVSSIKGVGPKKAAALSKLNIETMKIEQVVNVILK